MNDSRHSTAHPHVPQVPHAAHPVGAPQAPRPAVAAPQQPTVRPGIAPMPVTRPPQEDLDPIELVEEEEPTPVATPALHNAQHPAAPAAPAGPKKIIFGPETQRQHHDWKRAPLRTGTGACRVRSFHGKYSEQGLDYLDNAINEWLDSHPEIEVKFVTSTVMTFEGKIREPALVLNIWY